MMYRISYTTILEGVPSGWRWRMLWTWFHWWHLNQVMKKKGFWSKLMTFWDETFDDILRRDIWWRLYTLVYWEAQMRLRRSEGHPTLMMIVEAECWWKRRNWLIIWVCPRMLMTWWPRTLMTWWPRFMMKWNQFGWPWQTIEVRRWRGVAGGWLWQKGWTLGGECMELPEKP